MKRTYATVLIAGLALCAVITLAAFAVFDGGQKVYDLSLEKKFNEPPAVTVYVTENGAKFHRKTCSTIADSKNLTKLKREQAVEKGLDACLLCKP